MIINVIILKQLVASGDVKGTWIVTSISSRWLFADIHVSFGDKLLINQHIVFQKSNNIKSLFFKVPLL